VGADGVDPMHATFQIHIQSRRETRTSISAVKVPSKKANNIIPAKIQNKDSNGMSNTPVSLRPMTAQLQRKALHCRNGVRSDGTFR
jgi:hypothetical protein